MSLLKLPQVAHDLFGIDLTHDQQVAFERYLTEMLAWNENRANLTAITEPLDVEMRHFLDSLSVLKVATLRDGAKVIDVGSGAGFPGLPLKILCPGIQLSLLEATGKKTTFLEHMVDLLKLRGVKIVTARAEEAGHDPAHREMYDFVLARAVAQMPILAEYLLPLCRIGGKCIAMKGVSAAQESGQAEKALRVLGGRLAKLTPIELPHVAETHYLVEIDKVAATPPQFPRKPGIPSKKPIA
jgi:16S rRNA (guanine527-N7)-methyltransferase